MESRTTTAEQTSAKRPRSPSGDFTNPASKAPKTQMHHLQINYLARQYPDNLPLVSTEDNLPGILRLIGEYDGVLQRHESIAGNLGACPLGPILIKRFERLFDGPPRVLKSHGKEGTTVTWLDIVEFAKNKPEQFNLEKTRNGVRVCQFYTKQCRVEISEEDYVLIASGMPQKMIPPQPIIEDEEKELGALEILEKNLSQIIQMADQVSARARQLNHRLKNRKSAIIARRENDSSVHLHSSTAHSPTYRDYTTQDHGLTNGTGRLHDQSPPTGFVAVNASRAIGAGSNPAEDSREEPNLLSSQFMLSHPNTDKITIINGTSIKGASPGTREELLKKFFTTADRQARGYPLESEPSAPDSRPPSRPRPRGSDASDYAGNYNSSSGPVAIPNTPSSLLPQPKPTHHYERDDGGPYKTEMVARMEELQRGERILPPCDRCRRLQMDCLKNLTACMGCTKKHAKCSWKDVKEQELRDYPPPAPNRERPEETMHPDPRALGAATTARPERIERDTERTAERARSPILGRSDSISSAPIAGPELKASLPAAEPPRRAVSEMQPTAENGHLRRTSFNRNSITHHDDDTADATSRLMQAIMDTVDRRRL